MNNTIAACYGSSWYVRRVCDGPWTDGYHNVEYELNSALGKPIEYVQVRWEDSRPFPTGVRVNGSLYGDYIGEYLGWPTFQGGSAVFQEQNLFEVDLPIDPGTEPEPQPNECDTIAEEVQVGLETRQTIFGQVCSFPGIKQKPEFWGGAVLALTVPAPITGVTITTAAALCLRYGSIALKVLRAGSIIAAAEIGISVGQAIARYLWPTPIYPEPGDSLLIEYTGPEIDTCPLAPSMPADPILGPDGGPLPPLLPTWNEQGELIDPGRPGTQPLPQTWPTLEPRPIPQVPERFPPQEPEPTGDPCCDNVALQLYQIALQMKGVGDTIEWLGDVVGQRLLDVRDQGQKDSERIAEILDKIRKGVYHVRPGTTEEYPLAREILGILDGLNIHLK